MNNTSIKIKELATELWLMPEDKKPKFIRELLTDYGIQFIEHEFSQGTNFIIGNYPNCKTIISSHYDGPGMYDNSVGCIILILLALNTNEKGDISYVLFDKEEEGCLGALNFFNKNINFYQHIDIGGCGVGDFLFVKDPSTPFILKGKGKKYSFPFLTDATISRESVNKSWHLFFVDENDARLLCNETCPNVFFYLHNKRDNDKIISENHISNNLKHLSQIILSDDIARALEKENNIN